MSTSEESDRDDDDELLMAASAWASAQDEGSGGNNEDNDNDDVLSAPKKLKAKKEKGDAARSTEYDTKNKSDDVKNLHGNPSPPQNNYSLHLKNVPYDASQGDIRFAFGEKGCNVTSVRLVYDRDQKTGERHFRGVAFVDLADDNSYKLGLEFHNKSFLGKGRRVNVRPTRTKSELSDIVRRTEEKVATLIARSKVVAQTKKHGRDDDNSKSENAKKKQKRNNQKEKESPNGVRKSDPATAKPQSNAPEKNIDRKAKSKEKKDADSDDASDAPNTEPLSNETSATTKGPEKKKNEEATSKGRKRTSFKHRHDAPATNLQCNDTKQSSKGLTDKYGQTQSNRRESAGSDNKSESPGKKPQSKSTPEKSKGQEKKGMKRLKSKDGKSAGKGADVKLTKKQRAKKAAVIRMMKFKG
ncbi:hypothetical protein ACHAW5_001876 [Stephanodiscus triporus]|uniref:RRM domain-containing protein n=1 Tax=Stephanodiscus triporus TaxID=2934178 RepID=A0ABD3MCA0_9STRA